MYGVQTEMNDDRVAKLKRVEAAVKYEFKDIGLLDAALTHKSYVKGENNEGTFNERLEFLGDAVLELCVSEYLFANYPDMDEGVMTRLRANVVNGRSLYETGLALSLGDAVLLSRGEEHGGGREKPSILANCMEAVIGAMYFDGGRAEANAFILSWAAERIAELAKNACEKDYKTMLQEYVQKRRMGSIEYRIVDKSGPDHLRVFVMEVCIDGERLGLGEGHSKQEAGQRAASAALSALKAE